MLIANYSGISGLWLKNKIPTRVCVEPAMLPSDSGDLAEMNTVVGGYVRCNGVKQCKCSLLCGSFLFLDKEGECLDDALEAWLAAGSAPIYFGMGSMPQPPDLWDLVIKLSKLTGSR